MKVPKELYTHFVCESLEIRQHNLADHSATFDLRMGCTQVRRVDRLKEFSQGCLNLARVDQPCQCIQMSVLLNHIGSLEHGPRKYRFPDEGDTLLKERAEVHCGIYRIFSRIAHSSLPQEEDLLILQKTYAEAMINAHIVSLADGYTYTWWQEKEKRLDVPLWLIAHSGMEVLFSKELHRVKECPGDGCGWLFLDKSRNQSRRWCNAQDCGNRVRVRQHYQRHRTARKLEDKR